MMTHEHTPEVIIALYDQLADAEAALNDLQAAGLDYAVIQMGTHDARDYAGTLQPGALASGNVWSLTIPADAGATRDAQAALTNHNPLAVGRAPAPNKGRDEVTQGAIAWQHYRLNGPPGTDEVTDAAGTSGTTGIINSGAFADSDPNKTKQ
jgi:hypothetical protein